METARSRYPVEKARGFSTYQTGRGKVEGAADAFAEPAAVNAKLAGGAHFLDVLQMTVEGKP